LVQGNPNATGTVDMRARQFDPKLGVFLQEDPMGIAGGLNTYGFGGGDAVNMRDPSGLCPENFIENPDSRGNGKTWCVPIAVLDPVIITAPSPFFEAMRGLEGILNGVGGLSGINGLGQGAEQMGGGNIAGGLLTMAMSVPITPSAAPGRIFSARVLLRMAEETGPFHNFPRLIGEQVFRFGQRTRISASYIQYTMRGTVNGVEGVYEIGVRPSPGGNFETITHWFFRSR
jgi:RHS repeat-associated protein